MRSHRFVIAKSLPVCRAGTWLRSTIWLGWDSQRPNEDKLAVNIELKRGIHTRGGGAACWEHCNDDDDDGWNLCIFTRTQRTRRRLHNANLTRKISWFSWRRYARRAISQRKLSGSDGEYQWRKEKNCQKKKCPVKTTRLVRALCLIVNLFNGILSSIKNKLIIIKSNMGKIHKRIYLLWSDFESGVDEPIQAWEERVSCLKFDVPTMSIDL